ncbi:hypothetical protein CEXT_190791 [Caerostris extrusa]|uniref:Uncharacterized protein n=1 Tax=Caerostris extrusa TaxID=172846 RepID=A0AAV4VX33_CAEEX|nr:hypothetical protein CEXT_190791 [Caerostris extrusa]
MVSNLILVNNIASDDGFFGKFFRINCLLAVVGHIRESTETSTDFSMGWLLLIRNLGEGMVTVEQNYLHPIHPHLLKKVCLCLKYGWNYCYHCNVGEEIPIVDGNYKSESSTLETSSLTEKCLSVSNMVGTIDVTAVWEREWQL